ncbi:MAG TPA: hypothetical protein VE753_01445 [Gaiellaceae bacterium]|nr:hypothetical protein [Gaiellaceae bacterium]
MSNEPHYRDKALGAALRELDVPEHRPGFERELRELLERERTRGPHRRYSTWAVGAVVGAAAAGLMLAIVLPRLGSGPALAARVKAKAASALADGRTMRGVILSRFLRGPGETSRWSFAMTAGGDLRITNLDRSADSVYDASAGVLRSFNVAAALASGVRFPSVVTGVPPGPPDGGPGDEFLQRRLGAVVRALVAARDPRVTDSVFAGRKAWQVVLRTEPNRFYGDYDRLEVTIDQETGVVLRALYTLRGKVESELRVERLVVDRPLPPQTFVLRFPRGREVLRSDEGFRHVPLDRVSAVVGYQPLVPDRVPDGYRLSEVAVAREPASAESVQNPPSRDVVSLSYRRGFDQFLVTTRRRGDGSWGDPLGPSPGLTAHPRPVTLHGGALDGITGQIDVDPRTTPHLWALTPKLVVTVSGDLSRDELLAVAQSLR